jgi:hypothetical protein
MAPASPITTTTTLLRQSVVVSPSDRFRGGLSREPTWVPEARDRKCAALRGSANFENTTPHVRSRSRGVAFLAPPNASGFYGNLGRDTLLGPGLGAWDFSMLKNTAIGETLNLQFRAEFFNPLNRAISIRPTQWCSRLRECRRRPGSSRAPRLRRGGFSSV